GFTGHEHLEGHDTIHMNGRLYWPTGGRMVQADPIITDIYNPQNWNPYSYVLNNPLNLTDPSGYSFISKYWRTIAAIVITIYAPYAAPWIGLTSTQAVIAGGFVAGAVQTNSLRGGIYGAFSAGMFNKIGTVFQGMSATAGTAGTVGRTGLTAGQFTAKIVAHGMAGGVMSSLQGGKFGHGFASAGFSEAASPIVASRGGPISQGTAAAVIGGTASAMTGGKFANGAVTAAFSYAFNELMHYERTDSGEMTVRSPGESIDTEPLVSAVVTSLDAGENAAMHWAGMANETGNPFYDFLGGLASLWTPDTAFATATTLIPIGGGSSIGVRAGKEIRFGKNLRIAVFGNRTGHKYGELPHYHRRGIDPRTGGVIDGQGIGRHRPWEPKSTDRYFWDRF
ncbi:RHS repeat-associated core domain-containing protein, partial [Denitratimonas tolerans]